MNLKIECFEFVGLNSQWQFAVAKVGERWLGVALESQTVRATRAAFRSEGLPTTNGYMHVFSQVSEGHVLGMTDKKKAMLLVGALAEDVEQSFGGVDEWLVPEELRGDPEKFRCIRCAEVGCDGDVDCCGSEDDDFFDEEGE